MVLFLILCACIAAAAFVIAWDNKALELTKYSIGFSSLPEEFDGYKIIQISDLHNTVFGNNNEKLLNIIEAEAPDAIVITGDLFDSRRTNAPVAFQFAELATKIAPTYFTAGNHEGRIKSYPELKNGLEERGIVVLDNKTVPLKKDGADVWLLGLKDPRFIIKKRGEQMEAIVRRDVNKLVNERAGFKILLAHRPELFEIYEENGVNLVFSGHVHGGQFRFPGVGGLYMPDQGWFPQYDAGVYGNGSTKMVVSRGLGNSLFPFRLNNRPEVISVELKASSN